MIKLLPLSVGKHVNTGGEYGRISQEFPIAALTRVSIVSRGFARNAEPSFVKCWHIDNTEHRLMLVEERNEAPEGGLSVDKALGAVYRVNYPRPGSVGRYGTVFLSDHVVRWISFRNHLANNGLNFMIRRGNRGAVPFVFD
jgi:hypothetical protein